MGVSRSLTRRGPDGKIYVAQNGGIFVASAAAEPGVQVISGGRVEYLVVGIDAPNDLVIGPDARLRASVHQRLRFQPRCGTTDGNRDIRGASVELSHEASKNHKDSAEVLCTFDSGWPDGMAECADGTRWVTLTGGHRLDLVNQRGHTVDTVILPDGARRTNVCLNTASTNELLVTASFHQALLRMGPPETSRGKVPHAHGPSIAPPKGHARQGP